MTTVGTPAEVSAEVREGDYGSRVTAVEPGGAGFIPLSERHGRPLQLFWTWTSPNFEFATIFVGVLAAGVFCKSFGAAVAAIILGTALGSATHGLLSARGPSMGVPQMILSRIGFGYRGNILPAGINAILAGIGWFAVNSVSGALALATLTKLPDLLCLLIVVLAQVAISFFGHNLVQAFERYAFPVLAIIFVITSVVTLSKGHYSGPTPGVIGGLGGFLIAVGAAFGYAAGWNPYATDYTRYLPEKTSKSATGLWAALGVFVSCTLLEIVGAASATIATKTGLNPTAAFTSHLHTWLADLTLLAIALGAVSANAINIYSGSMSFLALGINLPGSIRRAIVSGVFGVLGFLLAWSGLHDAGEKYENFLLVISYWIGPWLAVYLTDWFLRRGKRVDGFLYDKAHNPWGGFVAMAVGMALSIWLFSNQTEYTGLVPKHWPSFGDIAFEAGYVISAILYVIFFQFQKDKNVSEAAVVA
jgi:NCS1 family nucleobase:cation symporter-1